MWEPPEPPELTAFELDALRREDQEREEAERQRATGVWEEQARLPLRRRDSMWWAGVALPNVLLTAWVLVTVAWVTHLI